MQVCSSISLQVQNICIELRPDLDTDKIFVSWMLSLLVAKGALLGIFCYKK